MKLIIGLGNYPDEYRSTRHNLGFLFLDFLAKQEGFEDFKLEKKLFGQASQGTLQGEKILLLKPHTYMNLSGQSVGAAAHFYRIEPSNILLIFDDIDLAFGEIRFRKKGASGGHNGVRSIIASLGTQEISRLKLGIANANRVKMPAEKFVLQNFSPEEQSALPDIFNQAQEKLISWISS